MASPEPALLELDLGGGEGARLRWTLPSSEEEKEALEAPASPWRFESEPEWRRLDSIRLISARFDDGRALGVVTLRPAGAQGHGDDVSVGRLVSPEGEETVTSEALVSVEFDSAGAPRRLGVELWADPDSSPARVAADRIGEAASPLGGEATAMRFRLDGVTGAGLYEILRRP